MSLLPQEILDCETEFSQIRFENPPTNEFKNTWMTDCQKRKLGTNVDVLRPIKKPDLKRFLSDRADNRIPISYARPPQRPRVQLDEVPVKKEGKLDTNNLLLLGLGAIIIILLIKK